MDDDTRGFLGAMSGITALVIIGVVLIAALVVGLWQAGFLFARENAANQGKVNSIQAHANQSGYANQTATEQHITSLLQDIATLQRDEQVTPANKAFDKPEILRDGGEICQLIPQLIIKPDYHVWYHANCVNGVLSPSSRLG